MSNSFRDLLADDLQQIVEGDDLSDTVVIQRATRTYDDSRQPVLTWATLATRLGVVRPATSAEKVTAGGPEAIATHVVLLSGAGEVRHDDRVTWSGGTYQILSVVDDMLLDATTLKIGKVET